MLEPADRRALIAALESEGLSITEWTDDAGVAYPAHAHPYREVRIVLEGSMTMVVDGRRCVLHPGARIDLAADEVHEAAVGPDGVRYLAGTDRPGRLPSAG